MRVNLLLVLFLMLLLSACTISTFDSINMNNPICLSSNTGVNPDKVVQIHGAIEGTSGSSYESNFDHSSTERSFNNVENSLVKACQSNPLRAVNNFQIIMSGYEEPLLLRSSRQLKILGNVIELEE